MRVQVRLDREEDVAAAIRAGARDLAVAGPPERVRALVGRVRMRCDDVRVTAGVAMPGAAALSARLLMARRLHEAGADRVAMAVEVPAGRAPALALDLRRLGAQARAGLPVVPQVRLPQAGAEAGEGAAQAAWVQGAASLAASGCAAVQIDLGDGAWRRDPRRAGRLAGWVGALRRAGAEVGVAGPGLIPSDLPWLARLGVDTVQIDCPEDGPGGVRLDEERVRRWIEALREAGAAPAAEAA